MIDKLRTVAQLKYENSKNKDEKTKYEIICKILKDAYCIRKMKTSTAYQLLKDLDFNEKEINDIYVELVLNTM